MSGSSPTLHQLYLANSGRPYPLRLEKVGADRPGRLSDFGAVGDRQLVERISRYDVLARVPDGDSAHQFLTAVPPEVPADRQRDHLWREPKPGAGRPVEWLEVDASGQLPQPGSTDTAGSDPVQQTRRGSPVPTRLCARHVRASRVERWSKAAAQMRSSD